MRQTASRAQTKYFDEGVIKVSDIDQHKSLAAKDNRRDSAREQQTSEEVERKPSREQPSDRKDSNVEEGREASKDGGESMSQVCFTYAACMLMFLTFTLAVLPFRAEATGYGREPDDAVAGSRDVADMWTAVVKLDAGF